MTTQELAAKIARAIFACGDDSPLGKTTRIQFRGTNDQPMGGLAEEPLARVIADAIFDAQADDRKGKK